MSSSTDKSKDSSCPYVNPMHDPEFRDRYYELYHQTRLGTEDPEKYEAIFEKFFGEDTDKYNQILDIAVKYKMLREEKLHKEHLNPKLCRLQEATSIALSLSAGTIASYIMFLKKFFDPDEGYSDNMDDELLIDRLKTVVYEPRVDEDP